MKNKIMEQEHFNNISTVYGPVNSWRFGKSLGIDLLFQTSTCSFNCIYCQLGDINLKTHQIKEYVTTKQVISDFKSIKKNHKRIDTITYSGSGEPTLAINIEEVIYELKKLDSSHTQQILTNATLLNNKEVRRKLLNLDRIIVKIDATNEYEFKKINRPVNGITLKDTIVGIKKLRLEYKGQLEIQTMFMPLSKIDLSKYIEIVKSISPDSIEINTPKRPYPHEWHKENRGNHIGIFDYKTQKLKTISNEELLKIADNIFFQTNILVISPKIK